MEFLDTKKREQPCRIKKASSKTGFYIFLIQLIIVLVILLWMRGKNVSTPNKMTFAAINPAITQSKC